MEGVGDGWASKMWYRVRWILRVGICLWDNDSTFKILWKIQLIDLEDAFEVRRPLMKKRERISE